NADVFALGVLLFEALSGRHPYSGASIEAKARAGVIPPLAERAPAVDREFCAIVDRMVHRDPSQRCSSAHDFYEPLLRLATRGGSRANARHLADWLLQLRDDFENSSASD